MKIRLILLLITAFSLAGFAYWKNSQESLPLYVLNPLANTKFLEKLHLYEAPTDFEDKIKAAVKSKDFAKLDQLGETYAKKRYQAGVDQDEVRKFFDTLAKKGTAASRPTEIKFAEEWRAARPESAVARITHAKLLLEYAWDARGDGYSNTVSKAGYQLFYARLREARQIIVSIPDDERVRYSESLGCLMTCARGLDMPHAQFVDLYLTLAEMAPRCSELHYKAAHFSTKQWGGKPGEWEQNLKKAIKDLPQEEADQVYAATFYRMVNRGHWFGAFDNVFKPAKVDVASLLRGLELLVKNTPEETSAHVYYLNALAHAIGHYKNDPIAGKKALKKADWQIHLDVWYSEKNFNYFYREWLERRFK